MAKLVWKGAEVRAKVATSAARAQDKTMSLCVADAKANHPAYPPASKPHERYANRTTFETGSIQIVEGPNGFAGAALVGTKVVGRWGALAHYSLFLEIGTSLSGPTATERMEAGGGDMDAIADPEGPKMAPRPYLRPAADKFYPGLGRRIGQDFRGEKMV